MATLLANRPKISSSYRARLLHLGCFRRRRRRPQFLSLGAMGGAAMIGLGLALAKPNAHVAVITGDGEMLMDLAVSPPSACRSRRTLPSWCSDNGLYGETGMQASHTSGGVDLLEVARGCGIERVDGGRGRGRLEGTRRASGHSTAHWFARVRIPRTIRHACCRRRTASRSRIASARALGLVLSGTSWLGKSPPVSNE